MKNKISTIAAACFAIVLFAACNKQSSQLALYVPADASVVFTVDTKALTTKISSSGLSIDSLTNLFANPLGENTVNWNDIQSSGISLDKPVYAFFKEANTMQQGYITSSGIIAEIKDQDQLETFFRNKKPGGNILSADKYKYLALGDDYIAGWADNVLIISQVTGGNEAPGNYSSGEGTLSQQELTTLFTQKKSASIAAAEGFEDMLAKPGDIHFYTSNATNATLEKLPAAASIQPLLKDSYTEGVINFEKGKITVSPVTHYNNTLAGMLNKYPSKQINRDMINSYPDTLTGFALLSFNPGIITDLLHYAAFDNMVDGFASGMGFTSNDFVHAFSGDVALMFSYNTSTTQALSADKISYLLNFDIADKALFDKILKGLLNNGLLTKNGDEYKLGKAGTQGFVIETGNNSLFIASSDELIKAYQSGDRKNVLPADIEKQISNKSMALYVDINSVLNDAAAGNSPAGIHPHDPYNMFSISQQAGQTFKNFIVTTDKGDNKSAKANIELNFVNKNENSLASLVKFIAVAKADQLKNWDNRPGGNSRDTSNKAENEND